MRLVRLIANLGYGSQKDVRALLRAGRVTDADGVVLTETASLDPALVRVDGRPLDPAAPLTVMLHKPAGFTCSSSDGGRIVYELLPDRFLRRKPVVAPVGRLDRDTTGLLLLTDDGQLSHRITAPRSHVPKVYEVDLARPLGGDEAALFAGGTLMLRSETTPLLPAELVVLGENRARLVLREGRYHQVKRMFAATGNHVERLRRVAIGGLTLGDLGEGQWRMLDPQDIARIRAEPAPKDCFSAPV